MQEWIIRYWLEFLFGLVIAVLSIAYQRLSCRVKQQEAIKLGMMALLWDRLYTIYNECERSGQISIDGLRNVENIYKQYHALGGNGTGTELYDRLCSLPTKKAQSIDLSERSK
jgi:hypothetical protein